MNISYIRSEDYYIPDLKLEEENRHIGKWGRMHREYLQEHHPIQFNTMVLAGNLWTYLADLNEQAKQRIHMRVKGKWNAAIHAVPPFCIFFIITWQTYVEKRDNQSSLPWC